MNANELGIKIQNLPDHLIPEVLDYVDFLLSKYGNKKIEKNESIPQFKFDWEGGLVALKDQYTSVELQHKALDWR